MHEKELHENPTTPLSLTYENYGDEGSSQRKTSQMSERILGVASSSPKMSSQGRKLSQGKILVSDSMPVDLEANRLDVGALRLANNLSPPSNKRLNTQEHLIIEDASERILANNSSIKFDTLDPNGTLSGEHKVDLVNKKVLDHQFSSQPHSPHESQASVRNQSRLFSQTTEMAD